MPVLLVALSMNQLAHFVSLPCFLADPVFQIAADMVGQGGRKLWQNEVQSSILEHAAQLRMTDVYEEFYNSHYANQ